MLRECTVRIGRELSSAPADPSSRRVVSARWGVRELLLGVPASVGFVPEPSAFVPAARAAVLRVPARRHPAGRNLRPASPASAKANVQTARHRFSRLLD